MLCTVCVVHCVNKMMELVLQIPRRHVKLSLGYRANRHSIDYVLKINLVMVRDV